MGGTDHMQWFVIFVSRHGVAYPYRGARQLDWPLSKCAFMEWCLESMTVTLQHVESKIADYGFAGITGSDTLGSVPP